jgi:Do/DeqQ family serine protease
MKIKSVLSTVAISAVTTLSIVWGYDYWNGSNDYLLGQNSGALPSNYRLAGFSESGNPPASVDFTQASMAAIPGVVHIKTKTKAKKVTNNLPGFRNNPFSDFFGDDDFFNQFFGPRSMIIPEQKASGSGVLISNDGYIVTNNHVVDKADEITVTLNNKTSFKATVIGTDPSYDLAVIKIEGKGLPFLLYGNSDDVKIGQWVLAIGYPLNLETTVTAGIISAKARSLGLNKDKNGNVQGGVESYIQTDAAVNMGNSGGALINTDGKLIGVNSAIASPTGYYSGYSYAIPVNIVRKVVDDIIEYGAVQRAYLGIGFVNASDLTEEQKEKQGIPANAQGIYVDNIPKDGGAYAAGIRKGDIIKKINNVPVSTSAEIQEQVSRYKPGDKIPVTYERNGKDATVTVSLRNKAGNYELVRKDAVLDRLGAEFAALEASKAKEYGVDGGVVVNRIKEGALNDQTRMKDGFIILKVDDENVNSVEELKNAMQSKKSLTISGFYPGYDGLYQYPISLDE